MTKAIMQITLEVAVDLQETEKLLGGISNEVGMHMLNVFLTRTGVDEAMFRRMSVDLIPTPEMKSPLLSADGLKPVTNE